MQIVLVDDGCQDNTLGKDKKRQCKDVESFVRLLLEQID